MTCSACQDLLLNSTLVAGKVVLCFASVARRVAIRSAAATLQEAGGTGLIIAKNPSDALTECSNDFPCIEVDYEIGTRILYYIRSAKYLHFPISIVTTISRLLCNPWFVVLKIYLHRSPTVKLSPSKTLVGKPVSAKVAFFSSRGPSSIAPEILKVDLFY